MKATIRDGTGEMPVASMPRTFSSSMPMTAKVWAIRVVSLCVASCRIAPIRRCNRISRVFALRQLADRRRLRASALLARRNRQCRSMGLRAIDCLACRERCQCAHAQVNADHGLRMHDRLHVISPDLQGDEQRGVLAANRGPLQRARKPHGLAHARPADEREPDPLAIRSEREPAIREFLRHADAIVVAFCLSDQFCDHGPFATLIAFRGGDALPIDSLPMSYRVF
jgi:hypothetical protein